MTALILTLCFAILYCWPLMAAWYRGHPQALPITILNLLLGWTGLVWILTLAWAYKAVDVEVTRDLGCGHQHARGLDGHPE